MRRNTALIVLGIIAAIAPAGTAGACRILIDNFNGGVAQGWTPFDFLVQGGPGVFDAGTEVYNLRSNGEIPDGAPRELISVWDGSTAPFFSDGFVEAKVLTTEVSNVVELLIRASIVDGDLRGYSFFADAATGLFGIARYNIGPTFTILGFGLSGFTPNQEWHIEGGAIGNQLTLKVWQGDLPPASPQLTRADPTYSAGQIAVRAIISNGHQGPGEIDGSFDDIVFTPPCPGDINGDGAVNVPDLLALLAAWGPCP